MREPVQDERARRDLGNLITTILDTAGLLSVAAGIGAWSIGCVNGRGLAVTGAIVLLGSWLFARAADPAHVPVRTRLVSAGRWLAHRWDGVRLKRKAVRALRAGGTPMVLVDQP